MCQKLKLDRLSFIKRLLKFFGEPQQKEAKNFEATPIRVHGGKRI
jgi:hypothetical protein